MSGCQQMKNKKQMSAELKRRCLIMDAGFEVFSNYGFKHTSMEDIAKVVGISRPALYQSFENKSDIFRALIVRQIEEAELELQHILAQKLPLNNAIKEILEASVLGPHRLLMTMRHREEFLGTTSLLMPEVFEQWGQQNRDAYRAVLLQVGGVDKNLAEDLTLMISNVVHGIKARNIDIDKMEEELSALRRIVVIAVRMGK